MTENQAEDVNPPENVFDAQEAAGPVGDEATESTFKNVSEEDDE